MRLGFMGRKIFASIWFPILCAARVNPGPRPCGDDLWHRREDAEAWSQGLSGHARARDRRRDRRCGFGAAGYQRGHAVAVAPNYGCGVCDQCVAGHTHHCQDLRAIGIHVDGGFAELVRVPAAAVAQGNVCAIPEGLSFGEAALVEPFSCVYASFERARLKPGGAVLIIGAGPIGLSTPSFTASPARAWS